MKPERFWVRLKLGVITVRSNDWINLSGLLSQCVKPERFWAHSNEDEQREKFNHYNALFQNGDTTFQTRYLRALNLASAYLVNDGLSETIGNRLLQINYNINQLVFDNMQKIKYQYQF